MRFGAGRPVIPPMRHTQPSSRDGGQTFGIPQVRRRGAVVTRQTCRRRPVVAVMVLTVMRRRGGRSFAMKIPRRCRLVPQCAVTGLPDMASLAGAGTIYGRFGGRAAVECVPFPVSRGRRGGVTPPGSSWMASMGAVNRRRTLAAMV